jgi:hypothetical protein
MSTNSIILFIAIGIKIALLGFIFQEKLALLLSAKNSATTTTYANKTVALEQVEESVQETEALTEEHTEEASEEETEPETTAEVSISSPV